MFGDVQACLACYGVVSILVIINYIPCERNTRIIGMQEYEVFPVAAVMRFTNIHIINKSNRSDEDSVSCQGLRGHHVNLFAKEELPGYVPACVQPVRQLAIEIALHGGQPAR
jgi:hypothetical protein